MQAEVQFDKDKYFPGDTLVAKFSLKGPFHNKSRNIQIRLESGEKIGVEYSTGSGNSRQTHTAWGDEIYADANEFMDIPHDSMGYIEQTLKYKIPEMYTDKIDEYKFDVFHRATVKLDIAMAKDEHFIFDIPLITGKPENIKSRPVEITENDVQLNISKDVGCVGDTIDGSFMLSKMKKMRGFRIEFEQMVFKKVGRHSDRIKRKYVLLELPGDEFHTFQFTVPKLDFQHIDGSYFALHTTLKLVVDIPLSRDINIPIDFMYFHNKLPESYSFGEKKKSNSSYCINCGSILDQEATFCGECGTQN